MLYFLTHTVTPNRHLSPNGLSPLASPVSPRSPRTWKTVKRISSPNVAIKRTHDKNFYEKGFRHEVVKSGGKKLVRTYFNPLPGKTRFKKEDKLVCGSQFFRILANP